MADFTAKDVQALRQATGAGMMDAKKALEENDGDFEAAAKWLREQGLVKAGDRAATGRTPRAPSPSSTTGNVAAIVELKCETDFVAKSDQFTSLVPGDRHPRGRQGRGRGRREGRRHRRPEGHAQGEHRRSVRSCASRRPRATSSTPTSTARTGAASTACSSSSTAARRSWPTRSPCTSRSPSPKYLRRDEVPEAEVAEERETLENITRAEGKPEAAMDKIVDGRLTGWFKDRVLLEQPYVKDEKQTDRAAARRRARSCGSPRSPSAAEGA